MQSYEPFETAVITGACGFLGLALVRLLLERGQMVWAVDHKKNAAKLPKREHLFFVETPFVTQPNLHCDIWYHLGWSGSRAKARTDAALQAENIRQTIQAVETAAELGCKKFVFAGSIMEAEVLQAQTQGIETQNAYGWAKHCAAHLGRIAAQQKNMCFVTARITNVYGAGENSERLISNSLRKIRMGEHLSFSAGKQNYDFLYVTDAARALAAIGKHGKDGMCYVLGSGQPQPLRLWLEELLEICKGTADFGKEVPEGICLPIAAYDTTTLCRDTGFMPQVSFAEGLRRTMAWQMEVET